MHYFWKILVIFLTFIYVNCEGDINEIKQDLEEDEKIAKIENEEKLKFQVWRNASISETFEKAVNAYLDEDWDACIEGFRQVVYKYNQYRKAIVECRKKCRKESMVEFKPMIRENMEDLHFYEKKIRETLCILKCSKEYRSRAGENSLKRLSPKEEGVLVAVAHYEYLHICYFKRNYYQEAANAVFTYLIYHPDHEASKSALRSYLELPGVEEKKVRNLESEAFVDDYLRGVESYESGNYEDAVFRFENSLFQYLESEENCRFYCEGPFHAGWDPDFTLAIANHFTYNLQCKRTCPRLLSTINGEHRKDFLVKHYNYLQYAYYKLKEIKEACRAVASYLTFLPADEAMLSNKEYYLRLPKISEQDFLPRKEAVRYVMRQEYELNLFLFINEKFSELDSEKDVKKKPEVQYFDK